MLYSCTHVAPLGVKGLSDGDNRLQNAVAETDNQHFTSCTTEDEELSV